MSQTDMENKNRALKKTTQTNLWLRIFVGAFIIYMMADVIKGLGDVSQTNFVILLLFSVLLIAASVFIIVWSAYKLIKKDYYDPIRDGTDGDNSAEEDIIDKEEKSENNQL